MQTTSFRITEVLRRVHEKSFTIPQFQRGFTWNEGQVKLLLDSIARNYPIGSVLLLTKSKDLTLSSRDIEAVIREGYPPDDLLSGAEESHSEVFYVLDGQQRITSVARVLMNAHPEKTYYFDLRKLLDDFPREESSWIVARQRGKNDPDRKDKGRLVRADIALDAQRAEVYVSEFLEDSDEMLEAIGDKTIRRKKAAEIKSVFEAIRNYQMPAVILERDAQVESVCRVFETINSTGTRLTTFDLAVAKYFPSPDLRNKWEMTVDDYKILKEFEVGGERVLQVIALIDGGIALKSIEPSRGALLALNAGYIDRTWDIAARSLAEAYSWARAQGARISTLPNHGVIVALAALWGVLELQDAPAYRVEPDVLRRWYFCKVLQAGGRQAANYRIGRDFSELMNYANRGDIPPFEKVPLSREEIIRLSRSADVRYKALQNLLYSTVQYDLLSGDVIPKDAELEDHHIFPRRLSRSHYLDLKLLDSVANRVPVLRKSNRDSSDQEPLAYIGAQVESAMQAGTSQALQLRYDSCLLPFSVEADSPEAVFERDQFRQFVNSRASLILDRVRGVLGNSLEDQGLSEDERLNDD
jgi:hypothetical protein